MGTRISYSLNGLPLDDDHCRVIVGTTWVAGISPRRSVTTVKGRHGTVTTGLTPRMDEREITVSVVAWGADRDDYVSRFLRVCAMPSLVLSKTVERDGQSWTMKTRVELTSLQPDGDERPAGMQARLTAVFAMPDVWWQSPERMVMEVPSSGGMMLPPAGPAITNGVGYWTRALGEPDNSPSVLANFVTMSAGPKDNSPSILYTGLPEGYFGDAPLTDVVVRVPACESVTVTNPVSGTTLRWSGSKPSGYLYVSTGLRAWSSSSSDAWESGTDLTTGVDYDGEPLEIWPAVDGSYSLDIETVGGSDGEAAVSFVRQWW